MNFFAYKKSRTIKLACLLLLATTLWTCNKEETVYNLPVYGPTQAFYALTTQNILTAYNAKDVRTAQANVTITGLAASEIMMAIDFRPATGELYGVSSLSKLYTIDASSGVAKAVSATAFSPLLNGTTINMDFNPIDDRIRIVTSSGQNFRVNPETAMVDGTDTNLTNTSISGIAHSNNFAGTATSVLYDLDPTAGKLYKQYPQNTGTLVNIGNLELSLGGSVCVDISSDNKVLAVGKIGDSTKLFTINLTSGKATLAGKFVLGTTIRSIAIPTSPVAYAVDNTNNLLIFNPTLEKPIFYSKALTGLQTGETILGMDMRPLNGQLYALGSSNRLYAVNTGTGALTSVGILSTALAGTGFGFDFNPLTDFIYIISSSGQNLRVNPANAAVTIDPTITPNTATISAAAFTNNFKTASSTVLYDIDHTTDKLYKQDLLTGKVSEVGALKVDITATNGFDILYRSGDVAYGAFTVGTKTSLYTVDLSSGEATAKFDFTKPISAFTVGLKFF